MRYHANKKVSRWRRRQQDPNQNQYVPLPFGGGHNLPKVNQVIYTLDKIRVPNIMVLAQAVFQIFCWQGSIGLHT